MSVKITLITILCLLSLLTNPHSVHGSRKANPYLKAQIFSDDPNLNQLLIRGMEKGIQGDYQGAIADFNKVIIINPYEITAYHNRGIAYIRLENYSQAIADFNYALLLDDQLAEVYLERAKVHLILNNQTKARSDLQIAAELFKKQGNTYSYQETQTLLRQIKPR
ncbi:MAG TPA: hypothetical protein DCF68_12345 [Cyanothece sp. UBA12306]|nr:hypothetical protein [Cyanothece sp. UBA12306]